MRALCIAACLMALLGTSCRQKDIRVAVIDVPAMKNAACVEHIVKALGREQGVNPNDVTVSLDDRQVEVRYDSLRHSVKNLEFTIAEAGFAANDVPTTDAARAALPPECR